MASGKDSEPVEAAIEAIQALDVDSKSISEITGDFAGTVRKWQNAGPVGGLQPSDYLLGNAEEEESYQKRDRPMPFEAQKPAPVKNLAESKPQEYPTYGQTRAYTRLQDKARKAIGLASLFDVAEDEQEAFMMATAAEHSVQQATPASQKTASAAEADIEPGSDVDMEDDISAGHATVDSDHSDYQAEDEEQEEEDEEQEDPDAENANGEFLRDEGFDEEELELVDIPRHHIPVNGQNVHVAHYFGHDWLDRIEALHKIGEMEQPVGMTRMPHGYQLRGAAQMDFLCKSPSRGGLLGDDMGLGKTIQAVLAIHAAQTSGGMSIVIAPMSVCDEWVNTFYGWFEPRHRLKVHKMTTGDITATELLSNGVDVLVVTYDQVLAHFKKHSAFVQEVAKERQADRTIVKLPTRPTTCLFTEIHRLTGRPFNRIVLDETQIVSKRRNEKWKAVKALSLLAHAVIMLSGTFAYNKWFAFGAYIGLLRNHPFTSDGRFLHTFADRKKRDGIDTPPAQKVKLLQRCLQALMIRRPAAVLDQVTDIQREDYTLNFEVNASDAASIQSWVDQYHNGCRMRAQSGVPRQISQSKDEDHPLGCAIKAQLLSSHIILLCEHEGKSKVNKGKKARGLQKAPLAILNSMGNAVAKEQTEEWEMLLTRAVDQKCLLHDSARMQAALALYDSLKRNYPGERMLFFSQFAKSLDIFARILKEHRNVECLRFDGSINADERAQVQREFANGDWCRPLLITTAAGGVGLNLMMASVVVIMEILWNENQEKQAAGRAARQGQDKVVKVIRLKATNSAIDWEMQRVQEKKAKHNSKLMEPLTRLPGQPPAFIRLNYRLGAPR